MRDKLKHFPVNWIDGMKIGKHHFIAQDNAWKNALNDNSSLLVTPLRYGLLPSSAQGEDNFNVKISVDNQNTVRVSVNALQAVTSGGIRISIPILNTVNQQQNDGVPGVSLRLSPSSAETVWWVIVLINPYERQPFGSPDLSENPPRYPFVAPSFTVEIVGDSQAKQYIGNPYALTVGKLTANDNNVLVNDEYIPPCFTISAHPDLISLYGELDKYQGNIELKCTQIVQKIYRKNQQNDISELVQFLCDRVVAHLSLSITQMRWLMMHDTPAALFANVASLSRVLKNAIDLRVGSGKDEMLAYLGEWCELKPGDLENMLTSLALVRYDNNDINQLIQKIVDFVKVTTKLFDTLSKLEFIGKKKESGIFVKEETDAGQDAMKARRRFFG